MGSCMSTEPHDAPTPSIHTAIHTGDIIHHHQIYTAIDVDDLESRLRTLLSQKMKRITEELNRNEFFPLLISKQNKAQRETFGRKGWFDETSNGDNTQFYDMLKLFEDSSTTVNSPGLTNDNVVGANGISGIGKTTMLKMIARTANDDISLQTSSFIFFVSFRDIDFSKPCSVLQFLTSSMLSDWDHTPESDKALLKRINEADDVHIFTDALDEARGMNFKDVAPKMNLFDIATPDVIFKNLYSGHLIPKAKKLLTSRPGAFHDLHPDYKPVFSVTVSGLSKESQELLCQQNCENVDDTEKVKAMFASNPSLSSLCFIPMFCRMTVSYLLQNINSDVPFLSSSDMFAFCLGQCLRSGRFKGHVSNISSIFKLALDGFVNHKFIFDVTDLQAADVHSLTVDAFMNTDVVGDENICFKILDGDKRYYFSHLLWQEYFSALQLLFFCSQEHFRTLFDHFGEDHYYSVVKFMFGLSNPLVLSKMRSMFPQITARGVALKLAELKSFLESFILKLPLHDYPQLTDSIDSSRLSYVLRGLLSSPDLGLFKICSWVYELQDVEVSALIANLLPEKLFIRGSILPSDVTCLCHVLANTLSIKILSVGTWNESATFTGEGLKIFLQNIHTAPHKVKKFHVKNQVINFSDLIYILHDIEELSLINCTNDDLEKILASLRQVVPPIKYLKISDDEKVLSAIEDCVKLLSDIEVLALVRCNINEETVQQLSIVTQQLDSPMKDLNLSCNEIGRGGALCLSLCIHNIQALELQDCKLSGSDVEVLAHKIAELKLPMKMLILNKNTIGALGVKSLAQCIHKIESLLLDGCRLTSEDVEMLTNNEDDLPKFLNLSRNRFGVTGVRHLCRRIHNIQHLWIQECELTDKDWKMLADAILERKSPMESFMIDHNRIAYHGAQNMSRCLHLIKALSVQGCNLTKEGISIFKSANSLNKQKCDIFRLDHQ